MLVLQDFADQTAVGEMVCKVLGGTISVQYYQVKKIRTCVVTLDVDTRLLL